MAIWRPMVTRKGKGERARSRFYWGSYTPPGALKSVKVSLKTTDRSAAEMIVSELQRRAAQEYAGIVNPYEPHAKRPLTEHVADWHAGLLDNAATKTYADLSKNRVTTILDAIHAATWADLDANRIAGYLAERRRDDLSVESSNHYTRRIKQFARWMVRTRRAPDSPLECLRVLNARTDRRHDRRAFEPDELLTLLETIRTAPVQLGMTGPDRAMLYALAVSSGLRSAELRSLTAGSFDLDADPAAVTVAAAYSKHRREDVQPLPDRLVTELHGYLDGRDRAAPVFTMPHPSGVSRMLRADLELSRERWIKAVRGRAEQQERRESGFLAYRDDAGRVLDFHAFRHTFISNLARGGVHPKTAQNLARHSTITLTMDRYTHMGRGVAAEALDTLPDLFPNTPEGEAVSATGTYDACASTRPEKGGKKSCMKSSLNPVRKGGKVSGPVRMNDTKCHLDETLGNKGFSACFAGDSATEGVGARTQNLRLKRPLLYH